LGVNADVNIGDDLSLLSDGSIINFGASREVNLTHVPSAGLVLNGHNKLQFNDSAVHISCDQPNYMKLGAATGVNVNISGNNTFKVDQNSASVISKNDSHSNLIIKSTNTTNGEAHLTMISDNSADVGDGFQFKVLNGVLTLSSDHNAIGTYSETILTITGHDTGDNRTTAVTGNLDVSAGVDVTGTITCSTDLDIEGNIDIEGDIDMATDKKITWVDDNQYISGSSTGITIETDDTLIVNSDTSSTFNTPTAIFTHTSNADLTIKSSNTSDGEAHLTMISDNSADVGDGFQFKVVNGVLTLSSDHNAIGTYGETILTITGHDTDSNRITAITGNLDVSAGVDVTGNITCSTDLDIEGDIDMATGKKITWVDDNQYISGSATGITIETDDTLTINSDSSSTFNTPTAIFTHTANSDLTIKSTNTNDGEAHLTMISDNGEDVGDGFQFKVVNGVLTLSSDHNAIGTYGETILTITGHDTDSSRTTAVTGNLTVSEDATISDDLSLLSDESVLNFGADKDINLTHIPDIGLKLNGTINKSTSGLIDGITKGSFTYTNPCGDLTANTNAGDTTVKSFDTTAYELSAISNYVPPTSATHMEITFNFTIYDENIASEFTLDLLIGSAVADNNIIKSTERHKYKQKYKMESRNQTNEYSKTFHLTLGDLDSVWGSTARNIKFKFTGANSNKIYLFTNSLTSITDKYITTNIQYPSISVKSHFY